MSLISTMLESTATLRRPTLGRDSASGVTQDPFVIVARNLACSVQQASIRVQELYAQRNSVVTTQLYFAQDPGAQVNDVLVAIDRTGRSSTYLVQGEAQAVGRGRLWSVDAQWVPQPT